jgi:hypothetical protein
MNELERHLNTHTKACAQFVTQLSSLIDIFAGVIQDEAITELKGLWLLVRGVLGPETITEQCSPYFLHFKDNILSDTPKDHELMLEFDYSKLIVDNCAQSTRNLINVLSDAIKNTWRRGDSVVNDSIRKTIIVLTKLASIRENTATLIDKLAV